MSVLAPPNLGLSLLATVQANRNDAEDGCSYWLGALRLGYPYLSFFDQTFPLHRFVAAMWNGHEAVSGKDVHHLCEHKSCINPRHLVCLTPQDHRAVHRKKMDPPAPRDMPVSEAFPMLCIEAALCPSQRQRRSP